jgi:hypothetical protein
MKRLSLAAGNADVVAALDRLLGAARFCGDRLRTTLPVSIDRRCRWAHRSPAGRRMAFLHHHSLRATAAHTFARGRREAVDGMSS